MGTELAKRWARVEDPVEAKTSADRGHRGNTGAPTAQCHWNPPAPTKYFSSSSPRPPATCTGQEGSITPPLYKRPGSVRSPLLLLPLLLSAAYRYRPTSSLVARSTPRTPPAQPPRPPAHIRRTATDTAIDLSDCPGRGRVPSIDRVPCRWLIR